MDTNEIEKILDMVDHMTDTLDDIDIDRYAMGIKEVDDVYEMLRRKIKEIENIKKKKEINKYLKVDKINKEYTQRSWRNIKWKYIS